MKPLPETTAMLGEVERLRELLSATNLNGVQLHRDANGDGSEIFTGDDDLLVDVYYNAAHSLDGSDIAAAIVESLNFLRSAAFEEMVRNDARYRWIRDPASIEGPSLVAVHGADELDTAIDTAMSAEGAK